MSKKIKIISSLVLVSISVSCGFSAFAETAAKSSNVSTDTPKENESDISDISRLQIDSQSYNLKDALDGKISIDKYVGDSVAFSIVNNKFKSYKFIIDGKELPDLVTGYYSADFTWKCTLSGEHTIKIMGVDDKKSTDTPGDAVVANVKINVINNRNEAPKVNKLLSEKQSDGSINFKTDAEGDGNLKYKYEIQRYDDPTNPEKISPYELLCDYSDNSTFNWSAAKDFKGSKYNIKVTVKNEYGYVTCNKYNFIDEKYGEMQEVSANGVLISNEMQELTAYLGTNVTFRAYNGAATYNLYVDGKQIDSSEHFNDLCFKAEKAGTYKIVLEAVGKINAKKEITLNVKRNSNSPLIENITFSNPDDGNNVKCIVNSDTLYDKDTQFKFEIFSKIVDPNKCTGYFVYPVDKYTLVSDFSNSNEAKWNQTPIQLSSGNAVYTLRITAKTKYGYDMRYIDYELPEKDSSTSMDFDEPNLAVIPKEQEGNATETPGSGTETPGSENKADTPGSEKANETPGSENGATKTPGSGEKENKIPENGDSSKTKTDNKEAASKTPSSIEDGKKIAPNADQKEADSSKSFDSKSPVALLFAGLISLFVAKKKIQKNSK